MCFITLRIFVVKSTFSFSGKIWKYFGKSAWYFISLPKDISTEIKVNHKYKIRGYGSIKIEILINQKKWKSSLFYSKEYETYLLPLKLQIRKSEKISEGDLLKVTIILK